MAKLILYFMTVTFLTLIACDGDSNSEARNKQNAVRKDFRTELSTAINAYFELKDALVNAESNAAIQKAASFQAALSNIQSGLLFGELLAGWKGRLSELDSAIEQLSSTGEITEQREAFLALSQAVIALVKDYGPLNNPVYVQHCPMAFDNAGGDWLSNTSEVINPYFGEGIMYHCGTTKETIEQN